MQSRELKEPKISGFLRNAKQKSIHYKQSGKYYGLLIFTESEQTNRIPAKAWFRSLCSLCISMKREWGGKQRHLLKLELSKWNAVVLPDDAWRCAALTTLLNPVLLFEWKLWKERTKRFCCACCFLFFILIYLLIFGEFGLHVYKASIQSFIVSV